MTMAMTKSKAALAVRSIKADLQQALHVLNSTSPDELTYEEAKAAANSATQAATSLHRLTGLLDNK